MVLLPDLSHIFYSFFFFYAFFALCVYARTYLHHAHHGNSLWHYGTTASYHYGTVDVDVDVDVTVTVTVTVTVDVDVGTDSLVQAS